MSATQDIKSKKDEDDLLNENIEDPSTGQVAEGNNTSIKKSPEKVDNLGVSSESGSKNIMDYIIKASTGDSTDVSNKNDTKNEFSEDQGEGDTGKQDNTVANEGTTLEMLSKAITDTKTPDIETAVEEPMFSDDDMEEEDLQLRWDDDDGNEVSDITDTKNEDTVEKPDTSTVDKPNEDKPHSPAIEILKGDKPPETKTDLEIPSEQSIAEKDAERILEDKLLEDDVDSNGVSKMLETDTGMDINEDELLKDDVVTETVKETDNIDNEMEHIHRDTTKDLSTDNTDKEQEKSLEAETDKKLESKDQAQTFIEEEKKLENEQEENKNDKSLFDDVMVKEEVPEDIPQNCNNNDDSQDGNQMDVDNSLNASMVDSPIHIKTDHGLHKPDVMLEIPTQELIDIDAVFDSPDVSKINEDDEKNDDIYDDENAGDVNDLVDDGKNEDTVQAEVANGKGEEAVNSMKDGTSHMEEVNVEKGATEVYEEPGPSKDQAPPIEEPQPSTSSAAFTPAPIIRMTPDTSDEVPEVSDSLGLLAESSRVMDDDEDQDEEDEGDDDDESDLDESSNQMTAEHSEDSNAQHSETDQVKEEKDTEDHGEEQEDNINECEEDFEYTLNDVGNEEQTDDNAKEAEEMTAEEFTAEDMNGEETKLEGMNEDELNAAILNIEGYSGEALDSVVKKEEEFDVELKLEEEFKTEEAKEGAVDKSSSEPLLPELKTADSEVKEEREDSEIIQREQESEPVKDSETELKNQSAVTGKDDAIPPIAEADTPKLPDDEDGAPVKTAEAVAEDQSPKETESQLPLVEEKSPAKPAVVQDKPAEEEQTSLEAGKSPPKTPKISVKCSAKLKELSVASVNNTSVLNIVDLDDSSEEDTQEVQQESQLKKLLESDPRPITKSLSIPEDMEMTSVNLPAGIEIKSTSAAGNSSEIVMKEGEVVISGLPKPPPIKQARLNTSEVTIKPATSSEQTLVIPEAKMNEPAQPEPKSKPKLSLEIFSLDSDEEDTTPKPPSPTSPAKPVLEPKKKKKKCINYSCTSGEKEFIPADPATTAYYDGSRKRRPMVCRQCAAAVKDRQQRLIDGIRDMTPLLQLDMTSISQDLVEILDSESEDEDPPVPDAKDAIGEEAAEFLEKNLAEYLNKAWQTHNLDDRLKDTQDELNAEIEKLESASAEINEMLSECQRVTDRLRADLYATFQHRIQDLPPILIYETPEFNYIGPEVDNTQPLMPVVDSTSRANTKRKLSATSEQPAKRAAIPMGYSPLDEHKQKPLDQSKPVDNKVLDDDKDISVVKLSAESAPADLPAPGELVRSPLRAGLSVFAMKNAFGPWMKAKILEIMPKNANSSFTTCRVKFDHKKNSGKVLSARCIAYAEPADVRLTIGTRLIALFKDSNKKESFYSGIVAEVPNPVNNYRYLVFFDDGYAQYVSHAYTRLVCECSPLVWEEVHPFSREFVREYLLAYPERPMVRLHEGQFLKTEWDGKWWSSRVVRVDASLAQVQFAHDARREWVYRGSTRLAPLYLELRAAERHRPRPMPRSMHVRSDMPYVEYTRSEEQASANKPEPPAPAQQNEESRRQRAVAKKSTASSAAPAPAPPAQQPNSNLDTVTSRVVYYTPKNAVRPYKLTPHRCSPKCKRSDVLSLKELRTYNPLAKPLLSGWERQIVRFKGQREVMYRAPCGRRLRNMRELHLYLRMTESDLPVDLFDFYHATHCLAEFVLNKCLVGKKDLSHGKENVPVPCVNYYDESLPEFCSYNTERTPTAGVPLNLDPEFLCGCDCTDDCEDKLRCACWQLTLEGARTIGLHGLNVGYEYKRLPDPLPSGIYECNSRCKCKETCLNRVAQHPLQLKLQVFKTLSRGWGIRALNDVPKGSFLCVYAGNLLTDATANLDGLNEGDEYLAELDYIEVVEQMKEGYEEDIPEADKQWTKENIKQEIFPEDPSSSEDEATSKYDREDDDFRPGYIGLGVTEFKRTRNSAPKSQQNRNNTLGSKRLRRRGRTEDQETTPKDTKDTKETKGKEVKENPDEECITISDDEEVREPSRFAAQPGMDGSEFVPKYKSVRALFGEDEACYIMDAKVQGNIGRYLNHSCSPNVFVQNVFVDTHDPRFPWVAFFALSHIKAGTELTWNYNYDVGSVPGKVLYCYCEAPNCRGRLL